MPQPKIFTLVCLRKPDLDTVAAGFLAGVRPGLHPVLPCGGNAPETLLDNPAVLCIECGGSGQTSRLNLDHHGEGSVLPTAAEQALRLFRRDSPRMHALAEYTAFIDSAGQRGKKPPYAANANLSALMSGVLLAHAEPAAAFQAGLKVLRQWAGTQAPPWDLSGLERHFPLWRSCLEARAAMKAALLAESKNIVCFATAIGPGLALCSIRYGVHGLLRDAGGKARLAARAGSPLRYSISVDPENIHWLRSLAARLNAADPGWGGPAGGSIVGSPFSGSRLEIQSVMTLMAAT